MHIDNLKSRIGDNESPRVKALEGQVDKLQRELEAMKKRLPPEAVQTEQKQNAK